MGASDGMFEAWREAQRDMTAEGTADVDDTGSVGTADGMAGAWRDAHREVAADIDVNGAETAAGAAADMEVAAALVVEVEAGVGVGVGVGTGAGTDSLGMDSAVDWRDDQRLLADDNGGVGAKAGTKGAGSLLVGTALAWRDDQRDVTDEEVVEGAPEAGAGAYEGDGAAVAAGSTGRDQREVSLLADDPLVVGPARTWADAGADAIGNVAERGKVDAVVAAEAVASAAWRPHRRAGAAAGLGSSMAAGGTVGAAAWKLDEMDTRPGRAGVGSASGLIWPSADSPLRRTAPPKTAIRALRLSLSSFKSGPSALCSAETGATVVLALRACAIAGDAPTAVLVGGADGEADAGPAQTTDERGKNDAVADDGLGDTAEAEVVGAVDAGAAVAGCAAAELASWARCFQLGVTGGVAVAFCANALARLAVPLRDGCESLSATGCASVGPARPAERTLPVSNDDDFCISARCCHERMGDTDDTSACAGAGARPEGIVTGACDSAAEGGPCCCNAVRDDRRVVVLDLNSDSRRSRISRSTFSRISRSSCTGSKAPEPTDNAGAGLGTVAVAAGVAVVVGAEALVETRDTVGAGAKEAFAVTWPLAWDEAALLGGHLEAGAVTGSWTGPWVGAEMGAGEGAEADVGEETFVFRGALERATSGSVSCDGRRGGGPGSRSRAGAAPGEPERAGAAALVVAGEAWLLVPCEGLAAELEEEVVVVVDEPLVLAVLSLIIAEAVVVDELLVLAVLPSMIPSLLFCFFSLRSSRSRRFSSSRAVRGSLAASLRKEPMESSAGVLAGDGASFAEPDEPLRENETDAVGAWA